MIQQLTLKNWRCHECTTLNFTKGTNLLVGNIGSGKSSCMHALCFALFGTFPELKSGRLNLSDVIMNRPTQKREACVELTLLHNGECYHIVRTIAAKGSNATLFNSEGATIAQGPREVNEFVERLLRIDYALFSRAIYSEQNRLDWLLTLAPGQRKKEIDDLLGIELFTSLERVVTQALNRASERRRDISLFLERGNYDELKKECQRAQIALSDTRAQEEQAAKRVEQLLLKVEETRVSVEGLEALEKEVAERRAALCALVRAADEIDAQLRALSASPALLWLESQKGQGSEFVQRCIEQSNAEVQSVSGEIASLRESIVKGVERLAAQRAALEAARAVVERVRVAQAELEKFVNFEEMLVERRAALAALEARAAAARSAIEEIQLAATKLSAAAKCPICETPLTPQRVEQLLEARRAALVEKEGELAGVLAALEGAKRECIEAERAAARARELLAIVKDGEGAVAQIEELEKEVRGCEDALEELRIRHAQAEQRANALSQQLRVQEEALRILALRERRGALERECAMVQEFLGAIAFDENALRVARDAHLRAERELAAARSALESVRALVVEREAALAQARQRLAAFEEMEREFCALERVLSELGLLKAAVVATQAQLRQQLIAAINEALLQIWPAVYPYRDYGALRLLAMGDDYRLQLKSGSEWIEIELASGGERSCAALALRIALATILTPGLSWLVLDEPTHNLDREATLLLAKALRDQVPSIVEQIFIITHDDVLRDATQAHTFCLSRDKGLNQPTQIGIW